MSPPINLDGNTVDAITMDGDSVSEVTVDGSTVFSAIPDSGLLHDFDATNITASDGDTISTWPDAQNNTDLTQGTSSAQPTYRTSGPNGNPYVEFGSDDEMSGSLSLSSPFEIFIAGRWKTTVSSSFTHFYIDSGFNVRLYDDDSSNPNSVARGANTVTGPQVDLNWHVYDIEHASSGKYLIDDASQGSADLSGSTSDWLLGRDNAAHEIEVGRVLIYSDTKGPSTSTQIHDILSDDYV